MHQDNISGYAQQFPPVIGIELLSKLLQRTERVISIDRCSRPDTLPPACIIPNTRRPLWVTADVISLLQQFREEPVVKLGAPTKATRVKKREAKR